MTNIFFASTYPPTMCGIADYTSFITRESIAERCGVLTFNGVKEKAPYLCNDAQTDKKVWHGIPSGDLLSASVIREGLSDLGARINDAVLWFQHENGIWPNDEKFVAMLKDLHMPKVVTFHTLHFQSLETASGLTLNQRNMLQAILPYVDAITVFSHGVYWAVISAFPEYAEKVSVLKHGIHSYPEISCLSRKEAKEKLNDFLLYESDLDQSTKESLHNKRILTDPDTFVLGQTGFLCPQKQSEALFVARYELEKRIVHKRVAAIRIGATREESHSIYAELLRGQENGRPKLLLETWLPPDILPLAQRAFDVNFSWPDDCTQSGVLAHALGAGAIVAGRDMEGVGETLSEAGQPVHKDMKYLLRQIRNLILSPESARQVEEESLKYAARFSWKNRAAKHFELAERIQYPVLPSDFQFYFPHTSNAFARSLIRAN